MPIRDYIFMLALLPLAGCTGGVRAFRTRPTPLAADAPILAAPGVSAAPDVVSSAAGSDPAGVGAVPATVQAATIRRLSNVELASSVQDIFMGGAPLTGSLLPLQPVRGGFDNQIAALDVTLPFLQTVQQVAEQASAYAAQNAAALAGCDTSQADCASQYISRVGRRAYRRPLSATELGELIALYGSRQTADGSALGVGAVVESLIQSPSFLYRTELGSSPTPSGLVTLTPFETAAALSYYVLASAPDDVLLDAAAAGQLATPAERAAQIRRLLTLPGAHAGAWNFMQQWAGLLDAATLTGNFGSQYPAFTADAASSALSATRSFFDQDLFSGNARWQDLFQPSVNGAATAGFLTQPAFLASYSDGGGFSPVHFGVFVATQLFCNAVAPPPPDVPVLAPDPTQSISPRQRFNAHLASATCAACHDQFDPMGWGFEQYTAIGGFLSSVAGTPLTGAGAVVNTDVNGDFTGPVQLGGKIARSHQAQGCFAAKLYEYALGRPAADSGGAPSTVYRASVAASASSFVADGDLVNLMVSVGSSPAFVLRDGSALPGQAGAP